tara:strand:+ start:2767 stop:3930 length:1164 start_codon:yes stop_codon:yes gene_type:complete
VKKICVVTGSRADYGLLRWIMEDIKKSNKLKLQLVVTGMHLSPEFGYTYREIESDQFHIDKKLEILISSDTPNGVTKSMGLAMISFADAIEELDPDLVLLLGDRFEIFCAASAAMVACVPIAHLHGGEVTEGAIDESIRHSITKMSNLHFVATETYRNRVIQLGEHPDNVFHVGSVGVDGLLKLNLLNRSELEGVLGFPLGGKNLLVTFHPVTRDKKSSIQQMEELLAALSNLSDTQLIFTMPNADVDGRTLSGRISDFVENNSNACVFSSLGQLRYLSCVKHVDGVVGNSSSGIIEVPALKKGTVNIGNRQHGRVKAKSVIDCEPTRESIYQAIQVLYSDQFKRKLDNLHNPYGVGGASQLVVQTLESLPLKPSVKKSFYDLRNEQ